MATLSAQEKQWRAESDANTLAEYQEIMADTKRRSAAVKAAKKKADDLNKRANLLKKASGGRISRRK